MTGAPMGWDKLNFASPDLSTDVQVAGGATSFSEPEESAMNRDVPTDESSRDEGHPTVKREQDARKTTTESPQKDAEVLPDDPDVEGVPGEESNPG